MLPAAAAAPPSRADRLLDRLSALNAQLHARSVYRALVAYAVACAGLIQFGDVLAKAVGGPADTTLYLVVAAVAGLPLTIAGSWVFEFRRGRRAATVAEPPAPLLPAAYVNNLPPQPTPFVGRERELAALQARLADPAGRLVTITGPGGAGKSRLALEAAARALPGFTHGVCVVSLAEVGAVELIAPAAAAALRLTPGGGDDALLPVLDYLREKRLLLVLDDFGDLVAGAPVLGRMLDAAPGVQALATSRERLGLPGELLFPLGGMQVAGGGEGEGEAEAVRLFLDGARRVLPEFAPDAEERACIGRICRLVEGLPLAIELASPWVRLLGCAEIEAEIRASQAFLAAQHAGVPLRHRSLRSAFESSWRHLDPGERRALRRLAVFRGGFGRAAAARVAGAELPVLSALTDKSLVRPAGPGRFEMLEVLRACAHDELREDAAEEAETLRLHAEHYAGLMRQVAQEHARHGGEHALRDAAAADLSNLRAAAEWAAANGEADALRDLLSGAFVFYDGQGRAVEGEESFDAAVEWIQAMRPSADAEPEAADRLLGWAMARHGVFLAQLGRAAPARERLQAALERARRHHDAGETALALQHLAGLACSAGEYDQAVWQEEEALALWRSLDDARGTGRGFTILGNVAYSRGDLGAARWAFTEAVKVLRTAGDAGPLFAPLCNLGIIASVEHDWAEARLLLGEALAVAREVGNARLVANTLQILGAAAWAAGDYAVAEAHLEEAVALCRNLGFRRLLAFCLNALGNVFTARGELRRAGEAAAAALAIAAEIGEAPLTLEVLTGFARLRRGEGRYAEAAELAALLLAHPATDQSTRTLVAALRAEIAPVLPAAELHAAEARGSAAELAATVARLRES
ncbi:MAG: ATP-binding protein [Longimicrobiaceae bacterium]